MYINQGAAKTGSALQLVDKVDKLLDGDAGSRQLTDVRLVPSVPASATPALENRRKHVCFRYFSRAGVVLAGIEGARRV